MSKNVNANIVTLLTQAMASIRTRCYLDVVDGVKFHEFARNSEYQRSIPYSKFKVCVFRSICVTDDLVRDAVCQFSQ